MLTRLAGLYRVLSRGSRTWHTTAQTCGARWQTSRAIWVEQPRLRRLLSCQSASPQTDGAAVEDHPRDHVRPFSESNALYPEDQLPRVCPGCGAPGQTIDATAAGFFDVTKERRALRQSIARSAEDAVFEDVLRQGALGAHPREMLSQHDHEEQIRASNIQLCNRCHDLLYHSRGESIIHPSMQSIQEIIEESPHRYNHIYHVLDAADFPLSVIPNLQHSLHLPRLRTRNRRSVNVNWLHNRLAQVSFIITRSDLLAPKKEQVDTLMPYLQQVLRDALSRRDRNVRLGNVRCVSAKRGWWTRNVKEEIWERGGAGWMVGKVNVGKSALFEVVFPKGRDQESVDLSRLRDEARRDEDKMAAGGGAQYSDTPGLKGHEDSPTMSKLQSETRPESELQLNHFPPSHAEIELQDREYDQHSLLPPAQSETAYPTMPLVSSLPGTTASPIRIPFGNGKGELIDLPGVHRSSLDEHTQEESKKHLVMKSRVVPEQYTIKPGQSLLLGGGAIRISPQTEELVTLAYPFVPPALNAHVTNNSKAVAIQTGVYPDDAEPNVAGERRAGLPYAGTVASILSQEAKTKIRSAGTFKLEWNVTKRRAGPLTYPAAGKQRADNLPFIVYSADLLIEGCGWVELVCQMRRHSDSLLPASMSSMPSTKMAPADELGALGALEQASRLENRPQEQAGEKSTESAFPEVEVFTPEGKYVGWRRPMNAWLIGGKKKVPKHERMVRPRQSIGMMKRRKGSSKPIVQN